MWLALENPGQTRECLFMGGVLLTVMEISIIVLSPKVMMKFPAFQDKFCKQKLDST
jgi:hypothetical protein